MSELERKESEHAKLEEEYKAVCEDLDRAHDHIALYVSSQEKLEAANKVLRGRLKAITSQIILSSFACAGDPKLKNEMKMYALWAAELEQAIKAADEIMKENG